VSAARFLIVRLGSLGDIIHAIPAAAALRAALPSAQIDWLVDPRYVDLVQMVTVVTHAVPVDPRAGMIRLFATLSELRRRKYKVAIDFQGLIKSATIARLAGETAPLILTALGNEFMQSSIFEPTDELTLRILKYARGPFEVWHQQAYGAAFVLVAGVTVAALLLRLATRGKGMKVQ